jgi:uncharacterized delta-60 repeat protein
MNHFVPPTNSSVQNIQNRDKKRRIKERPRRHFVRSNELGFDRLEDRRVLDGAIAGTLDLGFGVGGFATVVVGNEFTHGGANAVAIQPDGKVIVGGFAYNIASPTSITPLIARFNTDGTLDSSFATDGIYSDSNIRDLGSMDEAYHRMGAIQDIVVDSQGRITWGGFLRGVMGRVNSDGTRDTAFGNQSQYGSIYEGSFFSGDNGQLVKLISQTDGTLVSVGQRWTGVQTWNNITIQKATSNGQFDTSFGLQNDVGLTNADFSSNTVMADEFPTDAAQTADGKFVVVGLHVNRINGEEAPFIVRFNSDGSLDTTFGNGGQLLLLNGPSAHGGAGSIAITSQGKYLITLNGNEPFDHIVQLNSDGTFDSQFGGGDGIADLNTLRGIGGLFQLAIQSDGKIVVAGTEAAAAVWRLNSDGSPDLTFQNNPYGIPSLSVAAFPNHPGVNVATDIAIQANGQIVIVGANHYYLGEPIAPKGYAFGTARLDGGNQPTSITGRVFDDSNNDGSFQFATGELGLPGIIVTLAGTDNSSDSINVSTTTQSDGSFTFSGIFAGTYSITIGQPFGFLDGKETAGNLGGAVNNDIDSKTISGIVIGNDGIAATDYLFGNLSPSELSGLVWEDFNADGQVNFGEKAIGNVGIHLSGTDDRGNSVNLDFSTDSFGVYLFYDLRPGDYSLTEVQPAGFNDGVEDLGTVNGLPVGVLAGNDQFANIALSSGAAGINYNFGERPLDGGGVSSGQTATIGFWQNKNGRNLVLALNGGQNSTQLGNWLAATFPNMYGSAAGANNLAEKTNVQVWNFYNSLFRRKQQEAIALGLAGPNKVDAQIFATALAVYVTNQTLAGSTASSYGFVVTQNGLGTSTFNVGNSGQTFGVANNSDVSVMNLLLAVNARSRNGLLYDLDGDGDANDSQESGFRTITNSVFAAINEAGDN